MIIHPRMVCLASGRYARWRGLLAQLTLLKTRGSIRVRGRDDDDDIAVSLSSLTSALVLFFATGGEPTTIGVSESRVANLSERRT
jgi:hypothetical protein